MRRAARRRPRRSSAAQAGDPVPRACRRTFGLLTWRLHTRGARMSVKKLMDLSGRTAIVTGGSRGLGLQVAEALGEMGAMLAVTARKKDELEHAVEHLAK